MLIDPRGIFMPALPPSLKRDPSVTAIPVRDNGATTGWIVTTAIVGNNGGTINRKEN
jgi:hypothetical protein